MKIKAFILAVFISVCCAGEFLWGESYVPKVDVFIKSEGGDIKELLPGTEIPAGEDFYIIFDVSASMESSVKTIANFWKKKYIYAMLNFMSDSMSVMQDSSSLNCSDFMETTQSWTREWTEKKFISYDYVQDLRKFISEHRNGTQTFIVMIPVDSGTGRVVFKCRGSKQGESFLGIGFLDSDVPENFFHEYTLNVVDSNSSLVKEGFNAYEREDYETAFQLFSEGAKKGYAVAQYMLGFLYEEGNGVKQDFVTARYWYKKAADQGDEGAQFSLGTLYDMGKGVEQDYVTARYWYKKAADQGDEVAQYNLGLLYEFGRGVEQDYATARYWYKKSADQSLAWALLRLGFLYEEGRGVAKDYTSARYWYKKAYESTNVSVSKTALECLDRIGWD